MAYMNIVIKTDKQLMLLREPSFMSKVVFSGFVVGVLGVLIFGSETLMFKILIAFSAMIISSFIVDNYETLDINKPAGKAHITRMHFCQYLVNRALGAQPYTSCTLSDIQDVNIDEQDQGGKTKMYRVVLVLKSGIRLGITEVFTNDAKSEHQKVADILSSFIGIGTEQVAEKIEVNENIDGVNEDQLANDTDSSSSDDDKLLEDGFEKITQADIEKIEVKEVLPCDNGDNVKEKVSEEIPSSEVGSLPS